MTTMLTSREIIVGKWLGTFRAVPLLAVLPAAVASGFMYGQSDHWEEVGRLILYVLCAGAAITSLGLFMAIWHSRVGRAVAATVSVYVAITVGWFFLVLMLSGPGARSEGLLMASPFMWMLVATALISDAYPAAMGDQFVVWEIIWPVALAICAMVLLVASLLSFDRKFGRTEGPSLRLLHGEFTRFERRFGAAFVAIAVLATFVGMFATGGVSPAFLINGVQVSVGLYIAAIAVATSTSRQLGPDALARAPLYGRSSPRIVLAKWLGAYRLVALVALLATLVVLGHWDFRRDPMHSIWLVPIAILVVGAVVRSGRRPGHLSVPPTRRFS